MVSLHNNNNNEMGWGGKGDGGALEVLDMSSK